MTRPSAVVTSTVASFVEEPLAGLVTVDSRDDPRVQVADLLAGMARRSPETGYEVLLQPFLSPTSLRDPGR